MTVLPTADVRAVQSKTAALLSSDYSFSHLNLMSDPESIVTLPVGMYAIKFKKKQKKDVCLPSSGPNTQPCGTQ